MANPEAIHPHVPGDFLQQQRPIAVRRVQLLINAGALLISTAWSVIIVHTASRANEPSAVDGPACAPVAFLLFLLGVSLAMLALVADQFPGAARLGVAIARALHHYMFGGGN